METLPNSTQDAATSAADAALWRYGLISELLHGCSIGLTLSERLKLAAERTWNRPTKKWGPHKNGGG